MYACYSLINNFCDDSKACSKPEIINQLFYQDSCTHMNQIPKTLLIFNFFWKITKQNKNIITAHPNHNKCNIPHTSERSFTTHIPWEDWANNICWGRDHLDERQTFFREFQLIRKVYWTDISIDGKSWVSYEKEKSINQKVLVFQNILYYWKNLTW